MNNKFNEFIWYATWFTIFVAGFGSLINLTGLFFIEWWILLLLAISPMIGWILAMGIVAFYNWRT